MNKRKVGHRWEVVAATYLNAHGYKILELNFNCKFGEIDIIAKDGNYLVFCEVKYRKTVEAGLPIEAVSFYKQKRIISSALFYMSSHHLPDNTEVRFDVISILGSEISLIKNAFEFVEW